MSTRRSPARDAAAQAGATSIEPTDPNLEHDGAEEDSSGPVATPDPEVLKILPDKVRAGLNLAGSDHDAAAHLLAEACYVYGIDPNPKKKPRELGAFRFDPGDPDGVPPVSPYVSVVTAGGAKLKYPIDNDTEARLRVIFVAHRVDKEGKTVDLPLPPDLTLPRPYVDGVVHQTAHQYNQGYLKRDDARERAMSQIRKSGRIR